MLTLKRDTCFSNVKIVKMHTIGYCALQGVENGLLVVGILVYFNRLL